MGVRGGGGTDRIDDTSLFVGWFLKLAIAKVCAVMTWCAIRCTMFGRSSRQASRLADVQTQTKLLWSRPRIFNIAKGGLMGKPGGGHKRYWFKMSQIPQARVWLVRNTWYEVGHGHMMRSKRTFQCFQKGSTFRTQHHYARFRWVAFKRSNGFRTRRSRANSTG